MLHKLYTRNGYYLHVHVTASLPCPWPWMPGTYTISYIHVHVHNYYMYMYVYCIHVCKCTCTCTYKRIIASNLTDPGMSVSFPVTLVPVPLALSWSPGAARVEELNTRSGIVHGVLFAPQTFLLTCAIVCTTLNPRENVKVWLV